ncbi:asparaginase, partial [bacterium]
MSDAKILTEVSRGNTFEGYHRGWVAVCDNKGNLINGTHKTFPNIFARSSIKSIQALPFLLSGGMETFNFGLSELAVICSSHSSEKKHLDIVQKILAEIKLSESDLQCGTHIPYSAKVVKELIKTDKEPTPIYCNCSGKHAAMLGACLLNGWDIKTYMDYNHPLQKEVRKHLGIITGVNIDSLNWGTDGCGLPTYSLPLDKIAKIFSTLVNYQDALPEYYDSFKMITKACTTYPDLVAGEDRVDTIVMSATEGKLFSKIGGEAIFGMGLINEKISFAIKIEDGSNRPMLPTIARTLELLGFDVENT